MAELRVPAAGEIIGGRYRVERVLGMGGMGVVLAARHLQLRQLVAIKVIRDEAAADGQVVSRFLREAHAAVALSSEHATRVFDAGLLDTGSPYMVMEYLDGVDLEQVLRRDGPMALPQAVDFLLQACEAIAEAHAKGIVHRDLKPSNLFVARRIDGSPLIKVLDFGVSKVTGPSATGPGDLTSSAAIIGSPYYMSPEQMTSTKDVDAQTDVWALGVILYQMLTNRVPFSGQTIAEIAIKVATQLPPSLRELRPEVPEALEAAILKCLQKDRRARYAGVADLALAIVEHGTPASRASLERITGLRIAAVVDATPSIPEYTETLMAPGVTPAPGPGAVEGAIGSGTMSPVGRTGGASARRTAGVGILAVVLCAAVATMASVAWRAIHRDLPAPAGSAAAVVTPPSEAVTATVASVAGPETARLNEALPGAKASSQELPLAQPEASSTPERRRSPPPAGGDVSPRGRARSAGSPPMYNPLDHL